LSSCRGRGIRRRSCSSVSMTRVAMGRTCFEAKLRVPRDWRSSAPSSPPRSAPRGMFSVKRSSTAWPRRTQRCGA
ncbi:GIP, partial [Symbiodinium sp. CCMP2592]